jgi:hypothetical protein
MERQVTEQMPPGWENQVPPGPYGQPGYPPFGQPGYGQPSVGQPGYGRQGGRADAPAPGGIPLRPLGLGDMLNGAVTSARRNPAATFGLAAIVMTISGVLSAAFEAVARSPLAQLQRTEQALNSGQAPSQQQIDTLGSVFATLIPAVAIIIMLSLLLTSALTGMLSAVIGRGVLGRRVGLAEAWRAGRVGAVIVTTLLLLLIGICVPLPVVVVVLLLVLLHMTPVAALIGVLGGIASVVLGLLLIVRLSVTLPAVVLERISPASAVKRSFELSRGSYWRLFGIELVTWFLVIVASYVLAIPFAIAGGAGGLLSSSPNASAVGLIIVAIGGIVANTVTAPIIAGVVVLLYTDLRMRREGLDLALRTAAQGNGLTGDEFDSAWQPPAGGQPSAW